MYSWSDDPTSWYGSKPYSYGKTGADRRESAATRASEAGPRTYDRKGAPDTQRVDPTKRIKSRGKHPLVVAVDVTGSMARWPYEIFDRLPLLYNTLAQYREDVEISFIAIGDGGNDRYPLQVTQFADGFDLEQQLGSLYGEGAGGDIPESYGLLAWYLANRVDVSSSDHKPFCIVFGDAPMHPMTPAGQIQRICGVEVPGDVDAYTAWGDVQRTFDTWFLRRPTGRPGDEVDQSWQRALNAKRVVQIEDEQRAVDCAMGIVARAWGFLDDFKANMLARQPEDTVRRVTHWIERYGVTALNCPKCSAPVPAGAVGRFTCAHCGATLEV